MRWVPKVAIIFFLAIIVRPQTTSQQESACLAPSQPTRHRAATPHDPANIVQEGGKVIVDCGAANQTKPPDADLSHDLLTTLAAFAWPIVVLVVLVFWRNGISDLLDVLKRKIADAGKITIPGIIEVTDGEVEDLAPLPVEGGEVKNVE